jgi:hypothetical protein
MIKGSSRQMKDIEGRRPIDMLSNSIPPFARNDLISILGKQPFTIPCSQKKTPLKKHQRNYATFVVYVLLIGLTFLQLHLYILPYNPLKDWIF